MRSWLPASFLALRSYSLDQLRHDAIAGVTVGFIALPLAMAFAISSGLPPQAGLYCAVVTGFLISALGGSRFQIGGPTGAFVVIVAGIVADYGVSGLLTATMMAGFILVVLGATGLGTAVKFIPQPVILGFTNGIAVVIASAQLRDLFGLEVNSVPGEFIPRMQVLLEAGDTFSPLATLFGLGTIAFVLLWRRFVTTRVPGYIVVLVLGTLIVGTLNLDVPTVGSRFGGLPSGLPKLAMPEIQPGLLLTLLSPAMTIAMLGAVESLLSAVVADRMGGDRHNPNVELVAQGVANLASPLFGGLPATGALARTAANIRSGARTPVSGMIHALTVLLVLLVAAPLARFVPLPVLAGILVLVAYQMGEWHEIRPALRQSRADIAVWVTTFSLTVLADLTVAVEVGMVLAMLMFISKVSRTTTVASVQAADAADGRLHVIEEENLPDYVTVFRVYGPLMFGATDQVIAIADRTSTLTPIVIIKLRYMTAIDATGLRALEDVADALARSNRHLIVCGAQSQPAALLKRSGFDRRIGPENLCANTTQALQRAAVIASNLAIASSKLPA